MSRKFQKIESYDNSNENSYNLLPINFHRINNNKELIVNEIGDYLLCPNGTFEKIVKRKIKKTDKLYPDLISNFFISETKIPVLLDVMSTRYRTKKSFLDGYTSLHMFVLTLRCEHTCHYCQVSRVSPDQEKFDMSRKNIDRSIDLMFKSPSQGITMEFQGGEPLLAFDNLKYAVEKALKINEEKQKDLTIVVCSNLAIIDNEMVSFFKEHNILISTSLDGTKDIHNSNRKRPGNDSYQKTIEGIKKVRKKIGHDRVSALMTTSILSLDYPFEIIDEYQKLDFKGIFLRPISPYGFAVRSEKKNKYEMDRFLEFYKKGLEYIININLNGKFFMEDYASIILKKILTPFTIGYVDLTSPAGLINSAIIFNYDGKVYANDESRMLAEMGSEQFLLGHMQEKSYNELFYGNKTLDIAQIWSNEGLAGCSDCTFQSYCGADPVHNFATQGDMYGFRPTNTFCQMNMGIIRHLFELMENPEIESVFQSWVGSSNFDNFEREEYIC